MTSNLQIPDFFFEKLKGSNYLKLVEQVVSNYSSWILRNETIFFREYTDHGINHIESILETAELLLTESSKNKINDADSALLVVSTILHDVALHLQEYQFIKLVQKNSFCNKNDAIDTDTWHSLWVKYTAEASRFNKSQLELYFGVTEPIPIPSIDSYDDWKPVQYLLIGEFLRRHHTRLAHDFALFGFPAMDEGVEMFIKNEDGEFDNFIDLAGLVARSHGTNLRSLFNYLNQHFSHLRIQEGAHSIFVMVLLRIADFLQLQKSRAPKGQMIVKNLRSPLSRREWNMHSAIQDIRYDSHIDPESVEVLINPKKVNIEVFLRIKQLLSSLQYELDHSWAVLGEIYGRFPEQILGINIRRVRSNIDNTDLFGKLAGFVPQKATFTAADAELLKLFIKPLYGDKPQIAVRELVQNSVDAVRERLVFDSANSKLLNTPSITVSVSKKEDDKWVLKIEDQGIGMNLNTIINYFLNAGASFRLSRVWKEEFLDRYGKARVLRSGRFGVGALAAFMLADDPTEIEMKVTTRHLSAPESGGYEFKTKLSSKPIEISFINKESVGTTIEITTSTPPSFMAEIENKDIIKGWDWYCLDFPIVDRIGLNGKRILQSVKLPAKVESSSHDYHWIHPEGYDSIGWSYSKFPSVVCNGIIVTEQSPNYKFSVSDGEFIGKKIKIKMPNLSIFDKDGKLPITLDRLRIEYEKLQFIGDLNEDIEKNIAAFLVVCAPSLNPKVDIKKESRIIDTHPAIYWDLGKIPWLYTESGLILYSPELLHLTQCPHIIEVTSSKISTYLRDFISNSESKFSISIAPYSLWDFYYKKSNQIMYGHRLKVERPSISHIELQSLLNMIDIPVFNNTSIIDHNFINRELRDKYGLSRNALKENHVIFDLLRREIYHRFDGPEDRKFRYISEYFYEIERALDRGRLDIDKLKELLYKILVSKISTVNSLESEFRLLLEDTEFHNKERYTRNLIDEIDHLIRGIAHRSSNDELRYIFREKMDKHYHFDEFKSLNTENLKYIINELSSIEKKPATTNIEHFGVNESIIDWASLSDSRIKEEVSGYPIVEFCLNKSYKETSSNNILSKIWLKYIGENQIPYDSKLRENLINRLISDFNMERHIHHWKLELEKKVKL